jgi:hypothetical protein
MKHVSDEWQPVKSSDFFLVKDFEGKGSTE